MSQQNQQQLRQQEEENIKKILLTNPTYLRSNPNIDKVSNFYLPYSIGFEIECERKDSFNLEEFSSIPNIMEVDIDADEHRFRIPNGLNGFKCLFDIHEALCKNSLLNKGSGIHYHVDFTDIFDDYVNKESIKFIEPYTLEELDNWKYKGTYNKRQVGLNNRCWVNFQSCFKTAEIRIGEMTFDYELLVKRILDASRICKEVKNKMLLYSLNVKTVQKKVNKQAVVDSRVVSLY